MSRMRLTEHAQYAYPQQSHPLPLNAPTYCPVCGRPLEYWYWDSTNSRQRYLYRICMGGSWLAWLYRFTAMTVPEGAHYVYEIGPTDIPGPAVAFDRHTGKPLR